MSNKIYLIKSGQAMDLVRSFIAQVKITQQANSDLAKELGTEYGSTGRDGRLVAVSFPDAIPEGFTKPKRGRRGRHPLSYPKKGSDWEARFNALPAHPIATELISKTFNIPLSIAYTLNGSGQGQGSVGNPLNECGFMSVGNSTFALYIPDVAAEVEAHYPATEGYVLADESLRTYEFKLDGCEFIEPEEWQILQSKHQLEQKNKQVHNNAKKEQSGAQEPDPSKTFQENVKPWMDLCFGDEISNDTTERNHRFVEEAVELAQACGSTADECHQLVDYVFGRPVGEKYQEVGGVMVTLAALCLAQKLDMHECGNIELDRIWTKIDQIRAKQAAKPKHSVRP